MSSREVISIVERKQINRAGVPVALQRLCQLQSEDRQSVVAWKRRESGRANCEGGRLLTLKREEPH